MSLKNLQTFLFLVGILFSAISCQVNYDVTFHKNNEITSQVEVDFRQMLEAMKAMDSTGSDSGKKAFESMKNFPKVWTPIAEIDSIGGKVKDPDSLRLMKKMFLKGTFEGENMVGMSAKFANFTKKDFEELGKMDPKAGKGFGADVFDSWNGKQYTLKVDDIQKNLLKALSSKDGMMMGSGASDEESEEETDEADSAGGLMQMMFGKIKTTLHFENKIVSIKGKNDWVEKIDDHTVRLTYDLEQKDTKKKFSDTEIIITTE